MSEFSGHLIIYYHCDSNKFGGFLTIKLIAKIVINNKSALKILSGE